MIGTGAATIRRGSIVVAWIAVAATAMLAIGLETSWSADAFHVVEEHRRISAEH